MHFVAVKTADQQNVLMLHRMRSGLVEERTALVNRLRGELIEFGVFASNSKRRIGALIGCV
jgi:transposase